MKIIADYHTHTIYSCGGNEKRRHAKGTIEENVKMAIEKGIDIIGISEHGFNHLYYGLSKKNAKKQRKEIDRLNEKYPEIKILMGMECNILDDTGKIDMPDDMVEYFDYILAGYHFGSKPTSAGSLFNHIVNFIFRGYFSKKYNTNALVNAMKNNKILYITHPGDKGSVDIKKVADTAEKTGTGLEINSHHNRLSVEMLKEIKDMDIKFYIGSDAHEPKNIANFDESIKMAEQAGLDFDKIVNVDK
ncbi:PHP domain-containing protein [Peptostreptococcus faecalis]|uniref:PHP domain-containing protein n=1 Tax=Peptostreptococcus faecalis TaxID=2045015 RepID=UPI000C7E4422|nr:PHP domain-containing protein [Peptostreptococcus faecalis]